MFNNTTLLFIVYLIGLSTSLSLGGQAHIQADEIIEISKEDDDLDHRPLTRILGFAVSTSHLQDVNNNSYYLVHFDYIPARAVYEGHPFPRQSPDQYSLYWTKLKPGDRFRAPGGFYEIVERELGTIALKTLALEKYSDKNIYIIPGDNEMMIQNDYRTHASLHGTRIDAFLAASESKVVDRLNLDSYRFFKKEEAIDLRSETLGNQIVGVGDIVWIGDQGHEVTALFPPDPKKKLRGWAEICDTPAMKIVEGEIVPVENQESK